MKQWAVVDAQGAFVHGFDTKKDDYDQDAFHEIISGMEEPPDWYSEDLQLVDVTGHDPRPVLGFTLTKTGWVAPPPPPEPEEQPDPQPEA